MKFNTKFRSIRLDPIPCAYVPETSRLSLAAVEVAGGCGGRGAAERGVEEAEAQQEAGSRAGGAGGREDK